MEALSDKARDSVSARLKRRRKVFKAGQASRIRPLLDGNHSCTQGEPHDGAGDHVLAMYGQCGGNVTNVPVPILLFTQCYKFADAGTEPFDGSEVLKRGVSFMALKGPPAVFNGLSNFRRPPRKRLSPCGHPE